MCGIAGILDYQGRGRFTDSDLKAMCLALKHRGPDDQGIYSYSRGNLSIGLAQTRLKIIDLSMAGHQPMCNEDGKIWIIFNGEIYNYKDLRNELESGLHIFKSHTDTETVLHLYEEFGREGIKKLRGMFSLAIWDERKELLFLVRDRVGKKPLLYSFKDGLLCFASEFSALLESGQIDRKIDYNAINHYLVFGYIPAPLTIYKDIFKLPPAHWLTLENNKLTIERYWELEYGPKIKISEDDAAEEVLKQLKEAVKIRLYSDVPLGAFLSGGIDSSTVVALMSELAGKKVKTFSIGFEEGLYNELGFARNIAKVFSTQHTEFIVRPQAMKILPILVERYGEPYADSSSIPSYYVAEETRKYVTVALNGDGGDELFAGYERYQAALIADHYYRLPGLFKKLVSGSARLLPDSIEFKSKPRRLRRFLEAAGMSAQMRYLRWLGIFDENLLNELYSGSFMKEQSYSWSDSLGFLKTFFDNHNGLDSLDMLLNTDTHMYLVGDLLVKMDIATMANSLEARSPFLDHKLMEFVARLPSGYKIKNLTKKYILKKAIKGLVPEENINRTKMGFGVPIGEWLRNELRCLLCDNLLPQDSFVNKIFNRQAVQNIIRLHTQRKKDYASQIWALLMLELWHRKFMR